MPIFVDNRELLDRFRAGDRGALTSVYYHYVDEVARLVRRGFASDSGGHVPGAENIQAEQDLVHETFVRAFTDKARVAYDGLRPYRAYLMRIARNLLVDRARARRFTEIPDGGTASDQAVIDIAGSGEAIDPDWQRRAEATRDYLAGLDASLREYVRLRFEEEQSQADVARAMGVSRRVVRTWERRVQDDLRRHLRKLGLWP